MVGNLPAFVLYWSFTQREMKSMESIIAKHLCLKKQPVAILWADEMLPEAIHFQEGKWGCVVALIKAASQGKIAGATLATTVCRGGKVGLGFSGYEHGQITTKKHRTMWLFALPPAALKQSYIRSMPNKREQKPAILGLLTHRLERLSHRNSSALVFLTTDSWKWRKKLTAVSSPPTHGKLSRNGCEPYGNRATIPYNRPASPATEYDLLHQGYVALLRGLGRGYTVLRWHVRLGGSQALPAVPFYDKMEL